MRLISFGTYTLPEYDVQDNFSVAARSSIVELRNGGYDQESASISLKSRTFRRRFTVAGPDYDSTIDTLMTQMMKGRQILRAEMYDGSIRQTWAKITNVERDLNVGRIYGKHPVVITFQAPYPYWLSADDEPHYFDDGLLFDDGLTFDAGHYEDWSLTTNPQTVAINNTGGVRVPRGTITVQPGVGASVTNLKITNLANMMSLTYEDILADGDSLVIDLLTKSARLHGDDVYSAITLGENQIDWMTLELGSQNIQLSADALSGTIKIYWAWSRHWL